MTCALAWDVGPGAEPAPRLFRFYVAVDRATKATIEKRAKAANMSPDRYAQLLFDAALAGDVAVPERPAPVTPAALAAFAERHGLTPLQATVFSAIEAMAEDGVFSGSTEEVATRADTTRQTAHNAKVALVRAGCLERLPRPGRTAVLRLKVRMRKP